LQVFDAVSTDVLSTAPSPSPVHSPGHEAATTLDLAALAADDAAEDHSARGPFAVPCAPSSALDAAGGEGAPARSASESWHSRSSAVTLEDLADGDISIGSPASSSRSSSSNGGSDPGSHSMAVFPESVSPEAAARRDGTAGDGVAPPDDVELDWADDGLASEYLRPVDFRSPLLVRR
jgi:hypothetical protein